jgi:hypothetical protein
MKFAVGTVVHVRNIRDGSHVLARVGGVSHHRSTDQLDSTGRFMIAPKGYYYHVRYSPLLGVYGVHESRLTPALR